MYLTHEHIKEFKIFNNHQTYRISKLFSNIETMTENIYIYMYTVIIKATYVDLGLGKDNIIILCNAAMDVIMNKGKRYKGTQGKIYK